MASSAARAALAMRRLAASTKTGNVSGKRLMSGGHSEAEELAEMTKWRSVTMVVVPGCVLLAGYMLATAEHHHEEKIAYPYLHIRNKRFPWGTDFGFFEIPPKADAKHGHH